MRHYEEVSRSTLHKGKKAVGMHWAMVLQSALRQGNDALRSGFTEYTTPVKGGVQDALTRTGYYLHYRTSRTLYQTAPQTFLLCNTNDSA